MTGIPIELFCCYAREDEDDLKKLFQQLRVLERANLIHIWYDRAIKPGDYWEDAIDTHLNSAQIILLIVSASFIDSDYCYDKEMPSALARHASGQARVLPVLLHPCDWKITPLGRLHTLPSDGLPISLWPNQNSALLSVTEGVKRVAHELQIEALLKDGKAHYESMRYNAALSVFDQALTLALTQEEQIVPSSLLAQLYQGKGDALFIKKNLQDETWKNVLADALADYEKALHYDDSLLHSYEQKGRILFHLNRYEEAFVSLEEALTRGSCDPDVHFCKYETLLKLNHIDEALTLYEQTYSQWSLLGEPHLQAARFFEESGRLEQVLTVWERVISLMPNQTEGYLGKARVLECLERYIEALEVYEQVGKMNLNTAQLSLQKGQLLELLERDNEALQIFDAILQSPSNREQKDISGPAYFGKQRVYERLARKARTQAQTLEYMGCFRLFRTLRVSEKVRNPARSMAFSLDGCFLSTSYYVYPTELWDLSSGKMLRTFKNINPDDDRAYRSSGDAYCVTFSPDGHSLACSGQKATTIWDLFSGNLLSVFEGANHVAFSPDGHSLASTSGTTIKLLELSSGQVRQTLSHPDALSNHYVAFSPDNRFLASAANEYMTNTVVLWELPSGKVLDIYKDSRCLAWTDPIRGLHSQSQHL